MPPINHWADQYVEKKESAVDAVRRIEGGQRVFIGSSCGEPQHLVKALIDASGFEKGFSSIPRGVEDDLD